MPPPAQAFSGIVSRKIVSVAAKIFGVMRRLARKKAVAYDDLFAGARSKSELVATFLAVLELVKGKRIRVDGDGAGTTVRLIRDREGKSGGD